MIVRGMHNIFCGILVLLFAPKVLPAQVADNLSVGIAAVDISPKLGPNRPVYMAGFGWNRQATAVHDPIMARALVLADSKKKIALVSLDLVGLFYDRVETIRRQVKGLDYVVISCTHNHEGPDTLGLWGPSALISGIDPEYMKQVEKGVLQAIEQAQSSLKPVQARIGKINAPELLTDSRLPLIKHDELIVLQFLERGTKEKNRALLVQWNCHPETLDSKNTKLSSDYVHATIARLEKECGCPCIYFTGTVGGLMTSLKVPIKDKQGKLLEDGTFEKTKLFGQAVADKTLRALKQSQPVKLTPISVHVRKMLVPIENPGYKLAASIGVLQREFFSWSNDPLPEQPQRAKDLSKPIAVQTEIGALFCGELGIALIPGEIYPELVLDKVMDPAPKGSDFPEAAVEPALYPQMKSRHKMIIGLANDELGYFIPKRQWDEVPPYCFDRKKSQYGEINSTGPNTAAHLCDVFQKILQAKN